MKHLKQNRRKAVCLALALLITIMFVAMFTTPLSSAMSAVTIGVDTTGFDRNQGKYLHVGTYDIFAMSNKLMFYTASAVLAKTWDVPFNSSFIFGSSFGIFNTYYSRANINTVIVDYGDNTTIMVATAYGLNNRFTSGGNTYTATTTVFEYWLLNINTLTITYHGDSDNYISFYDHSDDGVDNLKQDIDPLGVAAASDLVVYYNNDTETIVATMGSHVDGINRAYIFEIETSGAILQYTAVDGEDRFLYGSSIWFTTNIDSGRKFYIISRNDVAGSRANLFVSVSWDLISIGTTGLDNTFGTYWNYFGGYTNQTVDGTNYIDLLFGFGYVDESDNQVLKVELLQFNYDTGDFNVIASLESSIVGFGDFPRVLSIGSADVSNFANITDGTYGAVYYSRSANQAVMEQYLFTISDIDTAAPVLGGAGQTTYQGVAIQFVTPTPNNIGALIDPFSTVGLIVDYTNSKCYGQNFAPISFGLGIGAGGSTSYDNGGGSGTTGGGGLVYTWTITPTPPYEDHINNVVQLYGSSFYTYTGNLMVYGVRALGTVRMEDANNPSNTAFKVLDNTGSFSSNLYTGSTAQEFYYNINITLTNFGGTYLTTLDVFALDGGPGGASVTPFPFPTGGGGNPGGGGALDGTTINYNLNIFVNFMLLFLCIGAPAFVLGAIMGTSGLIGGSILGVGIGTLAGLIPFWLVFLVGLALVFALIYFRRGKPSEGTIAKSEGAGESGE